MNDPIIQTQSVFEEKHSGTLLFKSIFDSCQDAIDFKTPDGIIRAWNPSAETLYGYTASEIVGQNVEILQTKASFEEFKKQLAETVNGRLQNRFETERVTKDGRIITVFLTLSPVVSLNGKLLGVSAISHDITEERSQENHRKRLERDREELLSILANDVSNSLNQLDRLVEQIDIPDSKDASQVASMLTLLRRDNRRFADTLDNLVLVYSLESGKPLEYSSVDLHKLFEVSKLEQQCLESASRSFNINLSDGLVVEGDLSLIRHLVLNLSTWACKQARSDTDINVSSTVSSNSIKVFIEFSGKPYGESEVEQLFSSSWRKSDGTETGSLSGLGLFLSKQIAQAHGGSLSMKVDKSKHLISLELPIRKNGANGVLELIREP